MRFVLFVGLVQCANTGGSKDSVWHVTHAAIAGQPTHLNIVRLGSIFATPFTNNHLTRRFLASHAIASKAVNRCMCAGSESSTAVPFFRNRFLNSPGSLNLMGALITLWLTSSIFLR